MAVSAPAWSPASQWRLLSSNSRAARRLASDVSEAGPVSSTPLAECFSRGASSGRSPECLSNGNKTSSAAMSVSRLVCGWLSGEFGAVGAAFDRPPRSQRVQPCPHGGCRELRHRSLPRTQEHDAARSPWVSRLKRGLRHTQYWLLGLNAPPVTTHGDDV